LLNDFGLGGRLDGGKGDARFDASWAGSPMAFQLAALDGTLTVNVKDGRLVEIEPGGTGRVLGLLSIAQLPRRLSLDFRDFFSKGFAFNKLGGTVRFSGGSARSEDFAINGPAASINIRGAANMRTQTFDQTIEVLPKTGNLLTAVGAIAGGPVGAAVGAVANAVLQKPLGQASAKNYRVTGPWKDPKVEVIERSGASARSAPGAG
ncbi:MAG: AsmA-like C-terminal region-containing protein, partial [Pseudomonadota bacterium]